MFRSDPSQRCGRRTPILARSFCKLPESAPPPVSPHCPLLVFLGLWCGATPRTQLTSYFLHEATPLTATPIPHSSSLCGLPGEKEVYPLGVPESLGLQQRQGPETCSFPKYKLHLYTMDPEVGSSEKGLESRQGWSCTWLCSHLAPVAQGLYKL